MVWAPSGVPVSYSTDQGTTWVASANIPQNAVLASDRVNHKKSYGYGQGKFWLSTDGGATFKATAATGLLTTLGTNLMIKAVAGHEGDVWVTNVNYDASIPPGGTASFGFNETQSGNNPIPTAFTVNGAVASVN